MTHKQWHILTFKFIINAAGNNKIKTVYLIKVCGDIENPCRSLLMGQMRKGLSRAV